MTMQRGDVIHGTGNAFRDIGFVDAEVLQLKATLAAEIVKLMEKEGLTLRAAATRTGVTVADLSRLRHADLRRFTVDRLMTILLKLGVKVEFKVRVKRAGNRAVAA